MSYKSRPFIIRKTDEQRFERRFRVSRHEVTPWVVAVSDKRVFCEQFSAGPKTAGKDRPLLLFRSRSSKISQEFGSLPLKHTPPNSLSVTHPLTHQHKQHGLDTREDF